jgi:transposase
MINPADLPDDIDLLRAMILASKADIAARDAHLADQNARIADRDGIIERKEDRIQCLEKLVADFKRALFGAKSEKADPEQYELALEDIETAMAAIHAEDEAVDPPKSKQAPRKSNRGHLPKHLPRVEEVIKPADMTCTCGAQCHIIGEDTSEKLDIIPAQFRVIVTRRPKYACRSCEAGIVQAPAKPRLIEGGMPTEATVASVIVSKYADHLPLYRQAQIYARQGVDLDRSTLASWVGKAAYELKPVYECLLANLKQSSKLFMDETTAPVLDPGRKKVKTGYFWALARDDRPWAGDAPPGVAFTYAPGRAGKYADNILQGFSGILQVDGYAGYNRLLKRVSQDVQLAYCWAHARRKLYDVAKAGVAPIAQEGLKQIAALYRIEADIKGQSTDARLGARIVRTKPMLADFEEWLTQSRAKVSAKSPTGEALKYIAKYWDGLNLFTSDGRIEIDNNPVERTIRPIALNRKNALFAGHEAGAQNWAMLASLIETCKLNAVEPHSYITSILTAIVNGHKQSDIEDLLPWNFKG